jgi:hypothetical protein
VFEGEDAQNLKSAALDGEVVNMVRDGQRVVCRYIHHHKKEQTLLVELKSK